jgi:hypothetical protein
LELDGQMLLLQDTGSTSTHAAGSSSTCAARVLLRSGRKKKVAGPARQHLAPVAGQRSSTPMQQLLPKLQQLDLSECKLRSVQPLLQLSRLTSLTSLNLGYGTFSDRTEQPSSGTGQQPQEQEQPISTAICTLLPHLKARRRAAATRRSGRHHACPCCPAIQPLAAAVQLRHQHLRHSSTHGRPPGRPPIWLDAPGSMGCT